MKTIWHGIEIPETFTTVGKATGRHIQLRLATYAMRRKWETHIWSIRTKKRLTFSVFVEPWDYLNKSRLDFSGPSELAADLLHSRASILSTPCGLQINDFRHTEGLQVIDATLQAMATQLTGGKRNAVR